MTTKRRTILAHFETGDGVCGEEWIEDTVESFWEPPPRARIRMVRQRPTLTEPISEVGPPMQTRFYDLVRWDRTPRGIEAWYEEFVRG